MRFKIGDRVYIREFEDTGTVIDIYDNNMGSGLVIVVDSDNPEKHRPLIPKEKIGELSANSSLNIHAPEHLVELIGVMKSDPEWAKIWDDQ